jgi:hypothetical protein
MPNSTRPIDITINEESLLENAKKIEKNGFFSTKESYEAVLNSEGEVIEYVPPTQNEKVTRLFIPLKEQYDVKRWDLQKAKLTLNGNELTLNGKKINGKEIKEIKVNVKTVDASGNDVSTEFAGVKESIKVKYNWTNRTITVAGLGACAFFGYTGYILNNLIGGAVLTKAAAFTAWWGGMGIIIGTAVLCVVVASRGAFLFEEAKKKEQCASTVGQTETPQSAAGISREQDPKIGTINTNNDRLHTIRGDVTVVAQKDGTGNKCP